MNMASTPPAPTMGTATCSWTASPCITMKPQVRGGAGKIRPHLLVSLSIPREPLTPLNESILSPCKPSSVISHHEDQLSPSSSPWNHTVGSLAVIKPNLFTFCRCPLLYFSSL